MRVKNVLQHKGWEEGGSTAGAGCSDCRVTPICQPDPAPLPSSIQLQKSGHTPAEWKHLCPKRVDC